MSAALPPQRPPAAAATSVASPPPVAAPSATFQWLSLHFPSAPALPAANSSSSSSPPSPTPPVGPSAVLSRVFEAHRPNPQAAIGANARRLCSKVISDAKDPRYDLTLRLYYALLENMTTAET